MKKILAAVIVFVMLFSMVVMAEPAEEKGKDAGKIDLSVMTLEELISLKNSVMAEISGRTDIDNDIIGIGAYLVGRDIKEGVFTIIIDENAAGSYKIFNSEENFANAEQFSWENTQAGDVITVNLKKGMVLELLGCYGTITEQAAPSWAP